MKNKYISIIIIFLSLLVVSLSFYWFQIRPSQIREDCSWTKKHQDASLGVTKVEADEKKAKCIEEQNENRVPGKLGDFYYDLGIEGCANMYRYIPPQDEKDWYEKASEEEYKFCLRSKGLK